MSARLGTKDSNLVFSFVSYTDTYREPEVISIYIYVREREREALEGLVSATPIVGLIEPGIGPLQKPLSTKPETFTHKLRAES